MKRAPGMCADCGNDAYIQLSGEDGSPTMLCAHCFVDRARVGKLPATRPAASTTSAPRPSPVR